VISGQIIYSYCKHR